MTEKRQPTTPKGQAATRGRRGKREATRSKMAAPDREPEGDTREKLLKAALALFTHRGYSATTVRELVEAAEATKPVLYYYFGNKEGLFLELMKTHFSRLEAIVDDYRGGKGSVRIRLRKMLDRGFHYIREDRDFIRLMHAVYFGPPGQAPYFDFEAYHQRYHDIITQFIEEGIKRGEFHSGKAGDMAWIVLGVMEIAVEDHICCQESQIDWDTFKRLLDLVFGCLSADRR